MRLEGRRAVVTGAAGALGRVIAETFAAEGADDAGLDLDAAGLDATGELVRAQGRRWTSAAVDLTDFDAVQEAVGKVVAEWGGVDVLLNGAGGGTVSPFHETTYATWTTQMDRNLNSVFNVTRAVPRRCSTSTTAGSSTSPRSRQ
jgi:3-oxoacyl-[acyl-carrier protein] reductase